jgi:hypothetical protein
MENTIENICTCNCKNHIHRKPKEKRTTLTHKDYEKKYLSKPGKMAQKKIRMKNYYEKNKSDLKTRAIANYHKKKELKENTPLEEIQLKK